MVKKFYVLLVSLLGIVSLSAQTFQDFLDHLYTLPPGERQQVVDSLIDHTADFPIKEQDTLAHFIFRGAATAVTLAGDFNSWNPTDVLANVDATNLWYKTRTFPAHARLDYKLILNGSNWILDPLNPHTVPGGFGSNSELAMPQYVQPWEIASQNGIPKGTVQTFTFASDIMGKNYQVQLYLPPSYPTVTNRSYPTAYVHDGQEYLSLGSAKNVIDNLIHEGSLSEMIGVFVKPNERNSEYAGNERTKYRQFIALELVPYIDSNYRTIPEAASRATVGTSFGGNISGLIIKYHSDVFGRAGLHSPAFWPNGFEVSNLLQQGLENPVRIASVWGTFESLDDNVQTVMDVLSGSGLETYTNRLPEGHSWGLWRATLDELLIFLFPPNATSTLDVEKQSSHLTVYPNPCPSPCRINLETAADRTLAWMLTGLNSNLVSSGVLPPGEQSIALPPDLPAGIYFIHFGNNGKSVKVIVH